MKDQNIQIYEKVKNMKSNENHCIYYVFERSRHQYSARCTFAIQKSSKITPAIQTYFWTPQITENTEKLCQMVSNGGPKIDQKSIKIQPGTIQDLP